MKFRAVSDGVSIALAVAFLVSAIAIFAGWVLNIINFVQALPVFDTLNIFRAIGIVIAPIGALLGWFA